MSAAVAAVPVLSPDELADICRSVEGCRVELDGTTYRVYPPNRGTSPVFFSSIRLRTSSGMANKISDLRRAGIDVRAILAERTKPTPKPGPPKQQEDPTTMTAERVPDISPAMTRREGAELREMVRKVSETCDALAGMLAEADRRVIAQAETIADQGAALDEVRAEVRHLRSAGPVAKPKAKPLSRAEVIRRAALAWFTAHPGTRMNPAGLAGNIGDDLPEDWQPSEIGGACRDLVKAGKIKGGATRDTPAARKGLYWYEPPARKSGAKA